MHHLLVWGHLEACRLHGEELDGNEPMYGSGKKADQKAVSKREESPIYFLPADIFKKLEVGYKSCNNRRLHRAPQELGRRRSGA